LNQFMCRSQYIAAGIQKVTLGRDKELETEEWRGGEGAGTMIVSWGALRRTCGRDNESIHQEDKDLFGGSGHRSICKHRLKKKGESRIA